MAKAHIIEDEKLVNIYNNGTKTLTGGEGSTLANKSTNSYTELASNMNNVMCGLGMDNWDDDISVEINGSTKSGLDSLIGACKSPADQIMVQVGTNVASYNSGFLSYKAKVEEHNLKVDEYNREEASLGSEPSPAYDENNVETSAHRAYKAQKAKVDELAGQVDRLAAEVQTWKTHCDGIISVIQGLLSPIESATSIAALGTTVGNAKNYTNESAEKYGYGPEYTVKGTRVTGPNGNIISETYEITAPDGTIVETGQVNYDSEGRQTSSSFYKRPPDVSTVDEIQQRQEELENQKIPGVLGYVDKSLTPLEEEGTERTEFSSDGEGNVNGFETQKTSSKKFPDGVTTETDLQTKGTVIKGEGGEDILIPEESVENTTINTPKGSYLFNETTQFEHGKKDSAFATLTQGDDVLATVGTDFVADYPDSLTGYNVAVTNKNITTDAAMTTISSIMYTTDGQGEIHAENVIMVRNNADPACGEITYPDGSSVTVSRLPSGELQVTESEPDKNGNMQSTTDIIPDQVTSDFTMHNSKTGEQNVMQLNMNNPLDNFLVQNMYQTARIEAGFNVSAGMDGFHLLRMGDGDQMEIQNPLSGDTSYVFALDHIE